MMLLLHLFLAASIADMAFAKFELYQNFSTNGNDVEFFEIGANKYLAWAAANQNVTKIYQWSNSGMLWAPYTEIPSLNCKGVTYFNLPAVKGDDHYLVISSFDWSTSQVYVWDLQYSPLPNFVNFQSLSVSASSKFQFTTIGSSYYLAVAQQNQYIQIFQWNVTKFDLFQSIQLVNAQNFGFALIEGDTYLCVAVGEEYVSSMIYVFSSSYGGFGMFQRLPAAIMATDCYAYSLNNTNYLAVSTAQLQIIIYQFDGELYEVQQTIQGNEQFNAIIAFSIDSNEYLGIASSGSRPSFAAPSLIYEYSETTKQYSEYQSFPTWDCQTLVFFTINNVNYLAVGNVGQGNHANINSQVYYWVAD